MEWNDYNGGKRHYAYARADEFPSKEEIIQSCESENKSASGCAMVAIMPLVGIAATLLTIALNIKWA